MSITTALAVLGFMGDMSASNDAREAAERLRQAGEKNAQLAEAETKERVARYQHEHRKLLGEQVVRYAKAGVVMEGTPLEVRAEALGMAEHEVAFMQKQGRLTAEARRLGANAQASGMDSQANSLLISGFSDGYKAGQEFGWWD